MSDAQHHDGPDILKHQDAQGEPAGQGAQFKLLIKQFHHDGGAAEGQTHRQVEQIVLADQDLDAENPVFKGFADGKPQQRKKPKPMAAQRMNWKIPVAIRDLPDSFSLLRFISSPIMNKRRIRPISVMILMSAWLLTPAEAELGADNRAGGQVG